MVRVSTSRYDWLAGIERAHFFGPIGDEATKFDVLSACDLVRACVRILSTMRTISRVLIALLPS